ncbi:MAG TPA: hypothetical protein VMJ34_19070 [Bryobacteraceae bacterium]|nr:hypothetical protein [Bryobacteraceae bacterium]
MIRRKRDHIDRFQGGFLAWWRKKMGAKLYHCIFCRLQFYSHLPLAASMTEERSMADEASRALDQKS